MEQPEEKPKQNSHTFHADFGGAPHFNPLDIPEELRILPRWVGWKLSDDSSKLPVDAKTGKLAKVNDRDTWSSFNKAQLVWCGGARFDGLGFVFGSGQYVGIDLDDCRDARTGAIEQWARAIIEELDSYTEISQSGTGVHIIVIGCMTEGRHRCGQVEIYNDKRYFVMTGNVLPGHELIFSRYLRDFERRMAKGTLQKEADQSESGENRKKEKDTSASGVQWKLICSYCERQKSRDADVLEAGFRAKHRREAAARDAEKGDRAGKTNTRYDIENWIKKNPEIEIDFGKKHDTKANCQTKSGIIEERLDQIEPQKAEWLWRSYIPAGRLTILAGDPGMGKSQIAIDLVSRISRGAAMPGCEERSHTGGCAIATAEDHTAETIVPRIMAAKGDRTKIKVIRKVNIDGKKRYFSLPRDLQALYRYISDRGLRVLVIDPLNAFLGANTDTYKDHDVRLALGPLEEIAEITGCAILIIAHLNKKEDSSTLYRVSGSIGFIGAARSVLAVSRSNQDEQMRVLYSLKSNLSKRPPALQYQMESNIKLDSTHITWHGLSSFDPERVGKGDGPQKLKECADFLRQELRDGEVSSKQIAQDAKAVGLSMRTINYYKHALGVSAAKHGEEWYWVPPTQWGKE